MYLIATIFSCIGAFCVLLSTISKEKTNTYKIQMIDCSANLIANLLLGGYTGATTIAVALMRNYLAIKGKMSKCPQVILCILTVTCGILFNTEGLMGLLPIIAGIEYIIIGCNPKNTLLTVKLALFINLALWAIYDFSIMAYPMFVADIMACALCMYSINELLKSQNTKNAVPTNTVCCSKI